MSATAKCSRCGGAGGWVGWPDFTCYLCRGTGVRVRLTREERATIKANTCRVCGAKPGDAHLSYCGNHPDAERLKAERLEVARRMCAQCGRPRTDHFLGCSERGA